MNSHSHPKPGRRAARTESTPSRHESGPGSPRKPASLWKGRQRTGTKSATFRPDPPATTAGRQVIPILWTQDLFAIAEHRRVQQSIEVRAREIWQESGRPTGQALAHWLAAEDEILTALADDPGRLLTLHPAFWGM